MPITAASWPEIRDHMDRIRTSCGTRPLTNCFTPLNHHEKLRMLTTESAIVFACRDEGFSRLFYHSADIPSLVALLTQWAPAETLVISYLDRTRNDSLCTAFRQCGFEEKAHYQRLSSSAFPTLGTTTQFDYAERAEAPQVMALLREAFDPMTDHLPAMPRLLQLIEQQQVIVRRHDDSVTGFVVFEVSGRRVNFNYLLNKGQRGDGVLLMHAFFQCMKERALTSGFLWVNTANGRARRLYEDTGWRADGLHDWFFVRSAA